MNWNYRVVHLYGVNGVKNIRRWDDLSVHEVYYDGDTPTTMTINSVSPAGATIKELQSSWTMYQAAFEKAVLFYDMDHDCFTDVDSWEAHVLEYSSTFDARDLS